MAIGTPSSVDIKWKFSSPRTVTVTILPSGWRTIVFERFAGIAEIVNAQNKETKRVMYL